jgi:hypothetical protein
MPEYAPDPGEFTEKLSMGNLFSIGPVIREGNADRAESCGPRAEVGQHRAPLARGGMPIKVATGEAATGELFGDLAKLLDEHFPRKSVDAPSVKSEPRTIHFLAAPYAV